MATRFTTGKTAENKEETYILNFQTTDPKKFRLILAIANKLTEHKFVEDCYPPTCGKCSYYDANKAVCKKTKRPMDAKDFCSKGDRN